MKKLLKKLSVMRLEERVLFDAAAAAAAAEAEQQAQQNEELQQQQQQLQEQLAEEAEQQAQQQQAAAEQQAQESEGDSGDGEDPAGTQGGAENKSEGVNAGSEVSAAVEAIAADEGIEVEESTDVLENDTDEVVGETVADVVATEVEADAEEGSADLEAAADAEESDEVLMTTEEVAAAIAEGTRHELVIVSSSVKDSKVIIDNLAEGTEVLVLEKGVDVLDQINEYLDSTAVKYDAIHVVSHGGDGYLVLNDSVIDMVSLQADPASWAAIGEHVAENGDIMLYGCNVAQTENGKAFANQLASLTGADIAASVDVTGGDYGWELEYVTNAIATPVLSFKGYNARLETFNVVVGKDDVYDTDQYANSDTTRFVLDGGALIQQTWVSAGEGLGYTHDASKDITIGGTLSWAITQANGSPLNADQIVVAIDGDLGNGGTVTQGVTILLGADNTATLDSINVTDGNISVQGGASVTVGNVTLGNGTSFPWRKLRVLLSMVISLLPVILPSPSVTFLLLQQSKFQPLVTFPSAISLPQPVTQLLRGLSPAVKAFPFHFQIFLPQPVTQLLPGLSPAVKAFPFHFQIFLPPVTQSMSAVRSMLQMLNLPAFQLTPAKLSM